MIPPELISIVAAALALVGFNMPATAYEPAVRGEQTQLVAPPAEPQYAPEGLDDCDEMTWYRIDAGLPERFDALGWRESNCRNEDGVKTYCCHGYWQLWVDLHLRDHRIAPRYAECGITSLHDVNSDTPEDKKRQACGAKALYDVMGFSPWNL